MAKESSKHDEKSRDERFKKFLNWFKHVEGKERKDAQPFLIELLRAFGTDNYKELGVTFEEAVVRKSTGRTGFADMVWGKRVLIEMKERGTDLKKHYQQIADYWFGLTPKPKYVCLCNFDEFWIYDFDIQMNDPIHFFKTEMLLDDYQALAFLFPQEQKPVFNNNHIEVTERAAEKMGLLYQSLVKRKITDERAQRFVLQLVVAMFSEDVGLIPKNTVLRILEEANEDPDSPVIERELFSLFEAMATEKKKDKPKKYQEIPYYNGGIFDHFEPIDLRHNEIADLYDAARENWAKVRPSIFGSIFEATVYEKRRHAHGIHYTSELDIMKIVNPTIIRPLREKLTEAGTNKKKVLAVLREIENFKVLDPACGSGNFLYIAFRELRRMEYEIRGLIEKDKASLISSSGVSLHNFFGIDINRFGLELAKVALSIGRKLSADEFGYSEDALPFEKLDENFINKDALFVEWPKTEAIIGNPPFLGGRNLRRDLGDEYVEKLYARFPEVRGQPDYCIFWFRLAHKSNARLIGLVGTNSIAQGFSREASLDFIIDTNGFIQDAVSTQEWSGEAAVHVSVVNWTKDQPQKLFLDGQLVNVITSSLTSSFSVTNAAIIVRNVGISFQGCELGGKGFIVPSDVAEKWIRARSLNKDVLYPMIDGTSLVDPSKRSFHVIDFNDFPIEKASKYLEPFEHVKKYVKPQRDGNRVKNTKDRWWMFRRRAPDMRLALEGRKCYFALPKVAKYTNFQAIDSSIRPCEANMVVASDDFFILGTLNSKLHRDWVGAQASTLEDRIRYTNTTCFETFPFLWDLSDEKKQPIRDVMTELEKFRLGEMKARKLSITKLYNEFFMEPTSKLHRLHVELDKRVYAAYGFKYSEEKNYNEELYRLNQQVAVIDPKSHGDTGAAQKKKK